MLISTRTNSLALLIYGAAGLIMYLFLSGHSLLSFWALVWVIAWPVLLVLKVVKGGVVLLGMASMAVGFYATLTGRYLYAAIGVGLGVVVLLIT